jgi:hypothetical protein
MAANWNLVKDMLKNAKGMHWDECHKIYLSMDDAQVAKSIEKGYENVAPDLDTLR